MIKPLPVINAIPVIKEIYTAGHSPLVVLGDDYNQYIVKNTRNKFPAYYIINEFLGHYIVKLWNIPTPDVVLIKIESDLLINVSEHHKKKYYNNFAFGSKVISEIIDMNSLSFSKKKLVFNKFEKSIDLLHIGLFDTWVHNDDRKPSNNNIIFHQNNNPKYSIFAIDHAYIFETLSYKDLNSEKFYPSANEHILLSDLSKTIIKYTKIDKKFVRREKEYFYFCLERTKQEFTKLAEYIPNQLGFDLEQQNYIKSFLFDEERNKKVFSEYIYRLKN